MLLAIDIGNTNITIAVFEKDTLVEKFKIPSDKNQLLKNHELILDSKIKKYNIDSCIIASVVSDLDNILKSILDDLFKIDSYILTNKSNLKIKLNVETPEKVGTDRIANASGANALYPKPAIVIDSGTATTFDIIDKDGDFIGGLIMPGLNLQLNSLGNNTSKLPQIHIEEVDSTIGKNTKEAILSGVIRGTACAIDGLITQTEAELGIKACIIGTGGDISIISKYMNRKFDYINPNLTLEGLKTIYENL